MQKTIFFLKTVMWGSLGLAMLIVVAYEMGWAEAGSFATSVRAEYVVSVVMELEALVFIPLALRLFKWKRVATALTQQKERALARWGLMRMLMLCFPMVLDTIFYYLFVNPAFGYLAIIHAICLMFVYPSADRCYAETVSKEESKQA